MTPQETDPLHPEDELLALRCQLGEPTAFDDLVGRWHQPLWRYVRRLTGDDEVAAETVQDVWLRVLRAIARLRDPARLRAWLFGIARRAVMDHLRERYAAPELVPTDAAGADLADLTSGDDAAAAAEAELAEDMALVQRELSRLPVLEREALTLFYLDELSLAEIAGVLAVPVGTVKSRLFRARRALREAVVAQAIPGAAMATGTTRDEAKPDEARPNQAKPNQAKPNEVKR